MQPEVRQAEPGKCPKCGMFLEPVGLPPGHGGPGPAQHGHDHHRHHAAAPLAAPAAAGKGDK
ncbi:heavy metal-binding domain-containing protein, partial [Acinetobacter baumannii]|uniref:heavy metal-binding domain-containing protein n=1 Tax=Acinetobacter baumannii TaxID=470 RepID=UPI003D295D92